MNAASWLPPAVAAAAVALLAALFTYAPAPLAYWSGEFATGTALTVVSVALLALALRLFAGTRAVPLLAAAAVLYLVPGLGILALAASLVAFSACLLLGKQVLAFMFPDRSASPTAAALCGLALYLTLFGLMIHVPVNYVPLYTLLFAAPLLAELAGGRMPLRLKELRAHYASLRAGAEALSYPAFVAAVTVAVLTARYGFMPTLGYDDNALHLGLWAQLLHGHAYEFDFRAQVWEVAPFAVDLLHASVNLVASGDARGATNVLLMTALLAQLWAVLGMLELSTGKRLLVLALFLSTPLAGYSLLTLQTELFMALLATSGARLILELRGWCTPHGAAILALAALCCATKLPGAGLGVMLLLAALWQLWRQRAHAEAATLRSGALLAAFTLVLAALAFNAYVTAWLKTGNPVFPLYNTIFESPHFPLLDFSDARWIRGFNLQSYVDLFFHTSGYFESRDFVAGFQYLLLLPFGLVALCLPGPQRAQAPLLLVPLFGYALFVFAATQYWRYQFPVLPLATAVIAVLLVPRRTRAGTWLVNTVFALCIALNLLFFPGITSLFDSAPERAWTARGKDELIASYVPARVLNEWLNTHAPGSHVLYPAERPYGATLDGAPVYPMWYSPATALAFNAIRSEDDGLAFMRERQITYVVAWSSAPGGPGTMNWAQRRFLARYGLPVLQAGDHTLYRIDGREIPYVSAYSDAATWSIDANPRLLGSFSTGTATAIRYNAEFACTSDDGYFAAQINWDSGQFYYHEVPCSAGSLQFIEAVPVPPGASAGDLWARVSGDNQAATLGSLSIEIH